VKHSAGLSLFEWLPDGRRLLVYDGGEPAILTAGTGKLRYLPVGAFAMSASISPDGRELVYGRPSMSDDMNALAELWRMRLDGSANRKIADGYNARWSPDGRHIAYVAAQGLVS
jgi:hypothetical protein